MKKLSPGLLAGIVAAAVLAAPAFAGPNVTVRVEGQNATLLDRTPVTMEPGVYLPGRGGVRIEDTLVVGPTAPTVLTDAPRELLVVG